MSVDQSERIIKCVSWKDPLLPRSFLLQFEHHKQNSFLLKCFGVEDEEFISKPEPMKPNTCMAADQITASKKICTSGDGPASAES